MATLGGLCLGDLVHQQPQRGVQAGQAQGRAAGVAELGPLDGDFSAPAGGGEPDAAGRLVGATTPDSPEATARRAELVAAGRALLSAEETA